MALKVSYVSDLHLEFMNFPDFSKDDGGDVLILAGDILTASLLRRDRTDSDAKKLKKYLFGDFKKFLNSYRVVLYVMGNHEHYRFNYNRTRPAIKRWLLDNEFKNVVTLENDFFVCDYDVVFVGASLWSDYERGSPFSMEACQSMMNDYHHIFNHQDTPEKWTTKITPEFLLTEHQFSRKYISTIADNKKDYSVVVVSHHAPTYKSINPRHSGNALNGAYASDLSDIILDRNNIRYWIHGHTHCNVDYEVGVCRVLSNQRGYPSEDSFNDFNGVKSFVV